jgi:hypothetical protein
MTFHVDSWGFFSYVISLTTRAFPAQAGVFRRLRAGTDWWMRFPRAGRGVPWAILEFRDADRFSPHAGVFLRMALGAGCQMQHSSAGRCQDGGHQGVRGSPWFSLASPFSIRASLSEMPFTCRYDRHLPNPAPSLALHPITESFTRPLFFATKSVVNLLAACASSFSWGQRPRISGVSTPRTRTSSIFTSSVHGYTATRRVSPSVTDSTSASTGPCMTLS